MENLYLIILFIFICLAYYWARKNRSREDNVYLAYAGDSHTGSATDSASLVGKKDSVIVQLPNGLYANSNKFYRIIIDGDCMKPVNINNNEEWLVDKINNKKDIHSRVRVGDVLFIYLHDKQQYKIRRVKGFVNNEAISTYYYDADGNEVVSSLPHSFDSVLGIVKYKLA